MRSFFHQQAHKVVVDSVRVAVVAGRNGDSIVGAPVLIEGLRVQLVAEQALEQVIDHVRRQLQRRQSQRPFQNGSLRKLAVHSTVDPIVGTIIEII